MPEEKKKLYVMEDGVRFRSAPDASNDANILHRLTKEQELDYVDGPWLKVKCGNKADDRVKMSFVVSFL